MIQPETRARTRIPIRKCQGCRRKGPPLRAYCLIAAVGTLCARGDDTGAYTAYINTQRGRLASFLALGGRATRSGQHPLPGCPTRSFARLCPFPVALPQVWVL